MLRTDGYLPAWLFMYTIHRPQSRYTRHLHFVLRDEKNDFRKDKFTHTPRGEVVRKMVRRREHQCTHAYRPEMVGGNQSNLAEQLDFTLGGARPFCPWPFRPAGYRTLP